VVSTSRNARSYSPKRTGNRTLASPALRIAFFGTPQVALPTLDGLLASRHEVVAVVSQPDRGRGRGRKPSPSPISERALSAGIPLLRYEKVGELEAIEDLRQYQPDLGVVVAYGQFIPKPVRTLPRLGYLINGHASLLPKYRGASPIAQAILDGEKYTGVSVMRVEKAMDAGPVALSRSIEIGDEETTGELTLRLSELAAQLLLEAIDAIAEEVVQWTEQDHARASVAPKLSRADGQIDWNQNTATCVRRINAMAPKPGAFTQLPEEGAGELRILRAKPYTGPASTIQGHDQSPRPGELLLADDSDAPPLRIRTADGWLVPLEVQRSGGKVMAPGAFLRGHPLSGGLLLDGRASGGEFP